MRRTTILGLVLVDYFIFYFQEEHMGNNMGNNIINNIIIRKTFYKLKHQKHSQNKFDFNRFVSLKNLNFSRLPIFIALAKAIPERANKIMILDVFEEFGKISSILLLNG